MAQMRKSEEKSCKKKNDNCEVGAEKKFEKKNLAMLVCMCVCVCVNFYLRWQRHSCATLISLVARHLVQHFAFDFFLFISLALKRLTLSFYSLYFNSVLVVVFGLHLILF